jgi:GNAT superfamily N-acetyltransferase
MKIDIRPAAPGDVTVILRFVRELAAFEKLLHEVEADEGRIRASLFPDGGRPAAECVLAFADGAPAGFALFFTSYSTFLGRPGIYLEDLFVPPEFRGKGVGRALLVHVARAARDRGCGRMEWSVLSWNKTAIDFYESLGATVMPDWRICRLTGEALKRMS